MKAGEGEADSLLDFIQRAIDCRYLADVSVVVDAFQSELQILLKGAIERELVNIGLIDRRQWPAARARRTKIEVNSSQMKTFNTWPSMYTL